MSTHHGNLDKRKLRCNGGRRSLDAVGNAKALGAAKGGSLHGIILRQAPSISNLSDAIVTLLALTVCLGVATLSWHFFERPIVQYGQRIRYRG